MTMMHAITFAMGLGNIVTSVLYAIALVGFLAFFIGKTDGTDQNTTKSSSVRWKPWEAISVSIFIYFFAQLFVGLTVYLALGILGQTEAQTTDWLSNAVVGQFIMTFLIDALAVGLLLLFLKSRRSTIKALGINRRPRLNDFGKALGGYLIYFGIYIIAATLVSKFVPAIDLEQKQQIGYDNVASLQLPLVFLSLVVLPPIMEELIMRGFLYTGLKNKLPRIVAIVITSVLFAVAHLQVGSGAPLLWVAAIDTFILSVVLIELKDRTGSLWASIFLHGLKNFVAFMSIFVLHLV